VLYLINSVKFFMQLHLYRNRGCNSWPWFQGLDLGLGLEICGLGLEHVGLGLALAMRLMALVLIQLALFPSLDASTIRLVVSVNIIIF